MGKGVFKNILKSVCKFAAFKIVYPLTYRICCLRKRRQGLTLFCEVRHDFLTDSYRPIYDKLKAGGVPTEVFYIHNNSGGLSYLKRYFKLCIILPTAETILIDDTCNLFGAFKFRKGTKLIQTWHSCGAFKKWGYSIAGLSFGQEPEDLDKYPAHRNYTLVTVSSEECIPHFNEAFGFSDATSCVRATGVARTDYFFCEANRRRAFERLYEVCPAAENKKVILYAPTYRGDADDAQPPEMFDIPKMMDRPDGCILLIKQHGFVKKPTFIPPECADRVFDVSKDMKIEELLFVSDVCITDYSSLIFEYSLFERPMVFYAYDLEDFYDYRGFYYKYDNDFLPGEITRTEQELFSAVDRAVNGGCDVGAVRRFRKRFMNACDGRSAERIANYITTGKYELLEEN